MRRLIFLSSLLFCSFGFSNSPSSTFAEGFDIQLQEAVYGDGVMSTEKGGIVKAKNFFLQARRLQYVRTGEGEAAVHKVIAEGDLFVRHQDRFYKGDKAEVDLVAGKLTVWNCVTQVGLYNISGDIVEAFADGHGTVSNASVSTSENENNDWSIKAKTATVTKDGRLTAQNVSFCFVKCPLFWVPMFSTDLLHLELGPFRYRARVGGGEGVRLGMSYLFQTYAFKHKALLDYSFKNGWGTGLVSRYANHDSPERFDSLNYLAQGKTHEWDHLRYRLQGHYTNFLDSSNLHCDGSYDKLSDRGMKRDFTDHALSDPRAGLTQGAIWRKEPDWLARVNARVRINNFQTIKQELPLFTFSQRPFRLGDSFLVLDNRLKTGYLNYVYAKDSLSVHNFASSRTELSQKLYTTLTASQLAFTPSIGYHLIHYSNSPQHDARLQGIGELGFGVKTRFINNAPSVQQILEPYADLSCMTKPLVRPDRSFIFDIDDGWARVNSVRYGVRHGFWFPEEAGFRPRVSYDLYSRSFFNTPHLPSSPFKVWLATTWDATPRLSFKVTPSWDLHRNRLNQLNALVRQTFSERFAITVEWRQRSAFSWRKLDHENFMVDAARSPYQLRHSEMSDARKTVITSLLWRFSPTLETEISAYQGWRPIRPHSYHYYEINLWTLIRGALQLKVTYQNRPGGPIGFYFKIALGPKQESDSTAFRKIGQGNYDVW